MEINLNENCFLEQMNGVFDFPSFVKLNLIVKQLMMGHHKCGFADLLVKCSYVSLTTGPTLIKSL